MSEPRGHHFVPQFYQRGFARRKGKSWQVRVLDQRTGQDRIASVADTFKRRDWNTVVDEDGAKDFAVEFALTRLIDAPAAKALHAMRDGKYPTVQQRYQIARFLSAQLTRGTQIRENLSAFVVEGMRRMASLAAEHYTDEQWIEAIGEVPTPEFRRQLLRNEEHFDLIPTTAMLLRPLLANVEEIADLLIPRTWTLVQFSAPCLLTGEQPVVYINPSRVVFGYGVATSMQIYVPVSTTHGLVLSRPWARWPDALVYGTEELARRLNWAIFTFPSNDELLLHPDVEGHPLPSVAVLDRSRNIWWPWPEEEHGGGDMPESWQRIVERREGRRAARRTANA